MDHVAVELARAAHFARERLDMLGMTNMPAEATKRAAARVEYMQAEKDWIAAETAFRAHMAKMEAGDAV